MNFLELIFSGTVESTYSIPLKLYSCTSSSTILAGLAWYYIRIFSRCIVIFFTKKWNWKNRITMYFSRVKYLSEKCEMGLQQSHFEVSMVILYNFLGFYMETLLPISIFEWILPNARTFFKFRGFAVNPKHVWINRFYVRIKFKIKSFHIYVFL